MRANNVTNSMDTTGSKNRKNNFSDGVSVEEIEIVQRITLMSKVNTPTVTMRSPAARAPRALSLGLHTHCHLCVECSSLKKSPRVNVLLSFPSLFKCHVFQNPFLTSVSKSSPRLIYLTSYPASFPSTALSPPDIECL